MGNKKLKKHTSVAVKNLLNTVLHLEANSASCVVLFQPKTPANLSEFRKKK